MILKKQDGSATVFALITLVFLAAVAAGLMPMLTTDLRYGMTTRDAIEAQFAAEAGAKRAIVAFMNADTNWSWLGSERVFADDPSITKTYNVSISPQITNGSAPSPGDYTITSIGKVGKVTKQVVVVVHVPSGGSGGGSHSDDPSYVTNYLIYAGGTITLDGSFTQHGKIAAQGSITQNGSLNADNQSSLLPHTAGIKWFPDFSVLTANIASGRPVNTSISNKGDVSLSGGNYNNQTIIVNGNLNIDNNTNFSNTTLYVTGTITVKGGGVNFNNSCYIVAGGDINVKGSPNLGGAVFISYDSIDMGGSGTLNSGAIYAKNDIKLHGSFVVTYGKNEIDNNISFSNGGSTSSTITVGAWSTK